VLHSLTTASTKFLFVILQVKEPEWFRVEIIKLMCLGCGRRGKFQSHFIKVFRDEAMKRIVINP